MGGGNWHLRTLLRWGAEEAEEEEEEVGALKRRRGGGVKSLQTQGEFVIKNTEFQSRSTTRFTVFIAASACHWPLTLAAAPHPLTLLLFSRSGPPPPSLAAHPRCNVVHECCQVCAVMGCDVRLRGEVEGGMKEESCLCPCGSTRCNRACSTQRALCCI